MNSLSFYVSGIPAPQGSKRAFIHKHGKLEGRIGMIEMSKRVKPWRAAVEAEAREAARLFGFEKIAEGPVSIAIEFFLPAPKRITKLYPTKRPDVDKLVRSTLDALSGVLFEDDLQVVNLHARKDWARDFTAPGARISISQFRSMDLTGGIGA